MQWLNEQIIMPPHVWELCLLLETIDLSHCDSGPVHSYNRERFNNSMHMFACHSSTFDFSANHEMTQKLIDSIDQWDYGSNSNCKSGQSVFVCSEDTVLQMLLSTL